MTFRNVAPFEIDSSLDNQFALKQFYDHQPDKLAPFLILSDDINSSRFMRARSYESIRAGLSACPAGRLSFYGNLLLDENLAKDPSYVGKKWRGLAGEIETSFLTYHSRKFDILAGRFGGNWGTAGQSLILSSTARPMDALSIRYRWDFLQFTYQAGQLNKIRPLDSLGDWQNRYFSGHRIDLKLSDHLNFGLFETIVYGGTGRGMELAYLNPFMFYHSVQLNEKMDDNTFLGFDAAFLIKNRVKLYGQFLIDDYQVENKSLSDREPNELGLMLGAQSVDLFHLFDLQVEYLRINNRVYNQKFERNRYDNRGQLIGHSLGPDADRWNLAVARWFSFERRIGLNLFYERHGEGSYLAPWSEPWLDTTSNFSESFPSGVVETQFSSALNFTGFIRGKFFIDLNSGVSLYRNFGHTQGDNRTVPYFSLRISYLYSALVEMH